MKSTRLSCLAQRALGLCARFVHQAADVVRHTGPCAALTPSAFPVLLLLCAGLSHAQTALQVASASGVNAARTESVLDKLPLSFEINQGQFDKRVKFLARGQRQRVFVTSEGIVLGLQNGGRSGASAVVRLEFRGGNKGAALQGIDRLETITNYFYGNDYTKYITTVPNFARVLQREVYPGIDVIYYGNQKQLEYDFVVAPGADAKWIKLQVSGYESVRLSESGDLLLTTHGGELALKRPRAYQEHDGQRVEVPARYVLKRNQIQFQVATYDSRRPLTIDPMVSYSTLFGGSANETGHGIAVDASGAVYITGETASTDLPVLSAFQSKLLDALDAYVTKLNAGGTGLVYSTYLGGRSGISSGSGIAVDTAGNAYITGSTNTSQFPVTQGAYQTAMLAGNANTGFVSKLGPQGNTLIYSTFVAGIYSGGGQIAVDANGNAVLAGTGAPGFLTTPGAFQAACSGDGIDAIVLKLNSTGTAAIYATFLGGNQEDISSGVAFDSAGNAYVAGYTRSTNFPVANALQSTLRGPQDGFVAKFSPTGAFVYSTYLGGSNADFIEGVAVDSQGNAYVSGGTKSLDFPVVRSQPAIISDFAVFIAKINATGNALVYSGTLSANGVAMLGGGGVAVDGAGNAYVGGNAQLTQFPQVDPIVNNLPNFTQALPFVAKVQELSMATLTYSTVFGIPGQPAGQAFGIAIDANANAYVVGYISNGPFPTTSGAYQHVLKGSAGLQQDAFVFKLSPGRFTTKLFFSPATPTSADTITLSAAVTNTAPGGTVTFSSDGNPIATVPVSGGGAVLTLNLPAGVHQLTAVYSGDGKVSQPLFLPVKQATTN